MCLWPINHLWLAPNPTQKSSPSQTYQCPTAARKNGRQGIDDIETLVSAAYETSTKPKRSTEPNSETLRSNRHQESISNLKRDVSAPESLLQFTRELKRDVSVPKSLPQFTRELKRDDPAPESLPQFTRELKRDVSVPKSLPQFTRRLRRDALQRTRHLRLTRIPTRAASRTEKPPQHTRKPIKKALQNLKADHIRRISPSSITKKS